MKQFFAGDVDDDYGDDYDDDDDDDEDDDQVDEDAGEDGEDDEVQACVSKICGLYASIHLYTRSLSLSLPPSLPLPPIDSFPASLFCLCLLSLRVKRMMTKEKRARSRRARAADQ